MRVIVLGATGAAGSEIVRQCSADPRVESILAVSRRPLEQSNPKLRVVLHRDFGDFGPIEGELGGIDVCFCALGISQVQEPNPARYRQITHDYVLNAARALDRKSPGVRFLFISGREIDPNSRRLYVRVKAETEADLRALFGERLVVFRPGYIHPVHKRNERVWQDTVFGPFMFLRPLLPEHVTDTREVARAMLHSALTQPGPSIFDNRSIHVAALEYEQRRPSA